MTVSIPVGSSDLVWIDGNKDMMMMMMMMMRVFQRFTK
jgi:hypothetical protein